MNRWKWLRREREGEAVEYTYEQATTMMILHYNLYRCTTVDYPYYIMDRPHNLCF